MVSGRRDGKKTFFPTQHYNVPYGRSRESFVANIVAEIDGILGWKYNADRVVFLRQLRYNASDF